MRWHSCNCEWYLVVLVRLWLLEELKIYGLVVEQEISVKFCPELLRKALLVDDNLSADVLQLLVQGVREFLDF